MSDNIQRQSDYDSPWKMALDAYFKEFLDLLFPKIHVQINWSQGYGFLDKELQQITVNANSGRRYADKLIKVYAKDGLETWVLIHVEIQGEPEEAFAQRMYTYNYRLRDRYQVDVVSLAVLADTRASFRPTEFNYQRWGCKLNFTFPITKLIDWEHCWDKIESSNNVFALVVMAQIHAKRLKDAATLEQVKVGLIRLLYERGYSREQVIELFNIIDWMIQLPQGLEQSFVQKVYDIQEETQMAYINTIERYERRMAVEEGVQLGIHEGRLEALQNLIQIKFGDLPDWAQLHLKQATQKQIEDWTAAILTADSLEAMLGYKPI